eukprot:2751928-Amphidinium_carterae.1
MLASDGYKVLWFDTISDRILRAALVIRGRRCLVIVAYAPHTKRPHEDQAAFLCALHEALEHPDLADLQDRLLLADLNLRTA